MTYDVVQVAGASIPRSTLKGIQVASAQSGVSFQYLLAKASQESGFKAEAEARARQIELEFIVFIFKSLHALSYILAKP